MRDDPCASWTEVGRAALGGAVIGGVSAAVPVPLVGRGLGLGGAMLLGAAGGAGGSAAGQYLGTGSVDAQAAGVSGLFGAVGGGLGNAAGLANSLAKVRTGASSSAAVNQGKNVGTGTSYLYGLAGDALGLPPAGAGDNCSCKR